VLTSATCGYDGRVFEINPRNGHVLRLLDSGLRFSNGIALDADGRLYVNETHNRQHFTATISLRRRPLSARGLAMSCRITGRLCWTGRHGFRR